MTTADVLREARRLYAATPSHAAPGDFPEPGTLCVVLAINEAAKTQDKGYGHSLRLYEEAEYTFARVVGGPFVGWNAEHSTEEVLAAFDEAIEAVA